MYGVEPAAAAQAALGPGVAYVRVPVWGGKTLRLLTFALNSRRLLKDAGPQVVFSLERVLSPRSTGPETAATGNFCPAAPPISTPLARAAQWLTPFHRMMLGIERRLFTSPELRRVIANSRQGRDEIIRLYGVDPARLRVIYNGLDRQRFHPLDPSAAAALRQRLGAPEHWRRNIICRFGL